MAFPTIRKVTDQFMRAIVDDEKAGLRIHPYHFLEQLLRDIGPDGKPLVVPLSCKIAAAAIIIRVRQPNLASSSNTNANTLDGSVSLRPGPIDRTAILSAIASLPTQAEREEACLRAAPLFGKSAQPL